MIETLTGLIIFAAVLALAFMPSALRRHRARRVVAQRLERL